MARRRYGTKSVFWRTIEKAERQLIASALAKHKTVKKAAKAIGLSPSGFWVKAIQFGLIEKKDGKRGGRYPAGSGSSPRQKVNLLSRSAVSQASEPSQPSGTDWLHQAGQPADMPSWLNPVASPKSPALDPDGSDSDPEDPSS
jgi:hypothetical protein